MAAEPKTRPTDESVEDFLNSLDDERKRADSFRVAEMMQRVSGERPVMWGSAIVGFGSQPLKYASGKELDWPKIGFSPRKASLTLYISGSFDDYDELMAKLGKHTKSKACLYIKRLSDVDLSVLEEIMHRSIAHTDENGCG